MLIKVSAASLRQRFHPCTPEFIKTVCRARCCESSTAPQGTLITIHPSEADRIKGLGGEVSDGILRTPGKRCTFKTADNLCGIHEAGQPIGCSITLNRSGTLIVRNRYRLLKCYRGEDAIEVYRAHGRALRVVFGDKEADRITDHLDAGGGDLVAEIPDAMYRLLIDNDAIKREAKSGSKENA